MNGERQQRSTKDGTSCRYAETIGSDADWRVTMQRFTATDRRSARRSGDRGGRTSRTWREHRRRIHATTCRRCAGDSLGRRARLTWGISSRVPSRTCHVNKTRLLIVRSGVASPSVAPIVRLCSLYVLDVLLSAQRLSSPRFSRPNHSHVPTNASRTNPTNAVLPVLYVPPLTLAVRRPP